MKREDFIKLLKRISKPSQLRQRVAQGLDHPDVLNIIERHEKAVAERKQQRLRRQRDAGETITALKFDRNPRSTA